MWTGRSLVAVDPRNLELLGATLALVGLLLLGALAVFWAGRWRRQPPPALPGPEHELSRYRTLYDQGLLSKDEFDRIHLQLEKKVSKGQPAPVQAPESPPAPNGPPR